MPKKQGERPSGREYIKEPPRRIMRIVERMSDVLEAMYPENRSKVDFAVGSQEDERELKLPVLARNQLRRERRRHPEARRHVAGLKDTIDQLSKPELLTLAEKFGIDVKAIIVGHRRFEHVPTPCGEITPYPLGPHGCCIWRWSSVTR
jgi:hypothetical protein